MHLTQIVGEKMQKVDLCEECAKEKGVNDPTGFSLADLLMGLGASQEMADAAGSAEARCPACGFTQADFKKAGRLGCAECYQAFADGLEGLLKTMHKDVRHRGKVPQALRGSQDARDRLASLQKRLARAVADEDYEMAAQLRDEIKALKERQSESAA